MKMVYNRLFRFFQDVYGQDFFDLVVNTLQEDRGGQSPVPSDEVLKFLIFFRKFERRQEFKIKSFLRKWEAAKQKGKKTPVYDTKLN